MAIQANGTSKQTERVNNASLVNTSQGHGQQMLPNGVFAMIREQKARA